MVVNDSKLIITGVLDGPLTGGLPKVLELYAMGDIPDLSVYAIGSANNGGGTDGPEFALSGSATAGSFITVASESVEFPNYFGQGESATFVSGSMDVNGDDAIELFKDGVVVDVFGDVNTDGTGQPWEYMDGWAYRNDFSIPSGNVFQQSQWTFSMINAVDGCTDNASCGSVFPYKTFVGVMSSPSPTLSPIACECLGASSPSPTNAVSHHVTQSTFLPYLFTAVIMLQI